MAQTRTNEKWLIPQTTLLLLGCLLACLAPVEGRGQQLRRLRYHHDGLVVDLGVGLWAWPLPVDYDSDGDWDLVVSCPDKPFNGAYLFENTQGPVKLPIFESPRRISRGLRNVQVSFVDGRPRVLGPKREFHEFLTSGLDVSRQLPVPEQIHKLVGTRSTKIRANQWISCDYDADGDQDLIVGVGDWSDYGWDDAFNSRGEWTHGPLHGFVYLIPNEGSDDQPSYAPAEKLLANGAPVDVYGRPSPNLADFDGDGDFDLLCGEFLDAFTYFQNIGSRSAPKFAEGRRLQFNGSALRMELQMIVPVAVDWDGDGDQDLIVGDEDGRVALVEHTGELDDGLPVYRQPAYFQQKADLVKCGALSTPHGIDWDGDGDDDILSGNTAGHIVFYENLGKSQDASDTPRWAAPRKLSAAGREIHLQAGPNGSIQGPCEAKWGYTTLTADDWDHDGLPDILVNSIWGKVVWFKNTGTREAPMLAAEQDVEVRWPKTPPKPAWTWWSPQARQLVTQWRTTPVIKDWNGDGLNDLIMLDHEGYLAFFERRRMANELVLLPPRRMFVDDSSGRPLRLNQRTAGGSGRRKLCIVDWDNDGQLDILANSKNAEWWRQVKPQAAQGKITLRNEGDLDERMISSHTTSPTTVDFNKNGVADLLVGAEDGHFYYLAR